MSWVADRAWPSRAMPCCTRCEPIVSGLEKLLDRLSIVLPCHVLSCLLFLTLCNNLVETPRLLPLTHYPGVQDPRQG
jgi:hypothetical protein